MNIYMILQELGISYNEIEHEAVFTVEQAQNIKNKIEGTGCKNLFHTDKKGKYFLVVLEENKRANISEIEKLTDTKHLSFANNEELKEILSLEQGSVTPLGIINDINNKVLMIIDRDLKSKKLLVHPNTNTKTISINFADLVKFIEYEKHKYILM